MFAVIAYFRSFLPLISRLILPLLIQVGQTMRIRGEGLVDIPENVASTPLTEGLETCHILEPRHWQKP